ncbi:MAG TPA: hypothetical protein VK829_18600, partial [Terriglobales bacterium]|nr:hypothetical protein [Terriglobales bacterium]
SLHSRTGDPKDYSLTQLISSGRKRATANLQPKYRTNNFFTASCPRFDLIVKGYGLGAPPPRGNTCQSPILFAAPLMNALPQLR